MKKKIVTNLKELRIPSEIITDKEEINSIIKDLEDSLDLSKGCGLSGVQIGVNKKVGIIRLGNVKINLVNPKIIDKCSRFRMEREGCLSLPGIIVSTSRYKEITIMNDDKEFVFDIEQDGICCIAIQHEINHMNGKLIIDKGIKWSKK